MKQLTVGDKVQVLASSLLGTPAAEAVVERAWPERDEYEVRFSPAMDDIGHCNAAGEVLIGPPIKGRLVVAV